MLLPLALSTPWRSAVHWAGRLLFIAVAVYVGFGLLLVLYQGQLVFVPGREVTATPSSVGLSFDDLRLSVGGPGDYIHAWYVPGPDGPERGTVLICHGNAGTLSDRLDTIQDFHRMGFAVLIFDYRGYGNSPGRPSEKKTYADAEAAWRYLVDTRKTAPERICLFGRSLGGAVAARLALGRNPGALVLESTFTSVPDMARRLYPLYPARLLARIRYDTLSIVGRLTCPIIVVHSPDDEIIPYEMGKRLFAAAPGIKRFIEIEGGHNEGFITSGTAYLGPLDAALAEFFPRVTVAPKQRPQ
ncbi:MAG: alpha/beta hydrolase [Kiritimatiellaeota bacterium]|nr:alpha/beta hydrolase [Kiritimatiellota bacterium]